MSLERYSQPYRTVGRLLSLIPRPVRQVVRIGKPSRIWFNLFCRPFGPFCTLPDLLLIGASKCGTSSMAAHLSSHTDLMPPFFKEVRYFDSSRVKTENEYRAHFPTAWYRRLKEFWLGRSVHIGDFSPTYFDHPHAPRLASELLGKRIHLILMLRNPVDRAFSQYRFQKDLGFEEESTFEEALRLEPARLRGEEERLQVDPSYFSKKRVRYGYVARGHYIHSLKNWHQFFDPARLLVVKFEDFQASPQKVFDQVCDSLGIPHQQIKSIVHNPSRVAEQLSPETRAQLVETFRESNQQLSQYLGREFDWDH